MSGGMLNVDVAGKADTVMSVKGDIATFTTERVRKGVSATNYTGIQADSAIADGLTYGATARSTLSGTGSLLYSSGANTLSELSAGTGEYTLKMNSGATAPEWVNVASGSTTVDEVSSALTSNWTTEETSFQEVTGLGVTILNSAGGVVIVSTTITAERSSIGGMVFALYNDGVPIPSSRTAFEVPATGSKYNISLGTSLSSDGSAIQLYAYTGGGILTIRGGTANYTSSINCIGVA